MYVRHHREDNFVRLLLTNNFLKDVAYLRFLLYVFTILLSLVDKTPENVDIIEKCIGTLGRWQFWVGIILCIIKAPVAWQQLNYIFIAPPTIFYCIEEELDQCASNCSEHVFDRSIFTETIITQWDLVCKNSSLANLSQTITMLGLLAGNIIFGYLSDKFGRRYPLIGGILLQLVIGVATAYVPWYPLFAVFRFLSGVALGGNMLVSYVFMMEIIGVKWRTTFSVAFHIPFDIGYMALPLISYYFRDWRDLQLAITLPTALLILSFFILSESPRWLLATGKKDKAIQILKQAATRNKLPTTYIEENVEKYMVKTQLETKRKAGNVLDLLKTPITRFYIISMCVNWLVSGLCYYGSGLYIGQLGGDIFINVAISGGLSIPGNLFAIYTIKAWGRKWSLIFGYIVGSISCLLIAVVPSEPTWIKTILGGIDMFGLIIAFSAAYIYVGELFPTYLRNVAAGTSSMFARVGSMVAPFILPLSDVAEWLPPLIFGIAPLIGIALCYQLPETIDCQLPDTIEEAEEFAKIKSKKALNNR